MRTLLYLAFAVVLLSCKESADRRHRLFTEAWMGKSVYYPADSVFESFEADSVRKYSRKRMPYTVVTYIDTARRNGTDTWHPEAWKAFLREFNQVAGGRATCLFFFHPANREEMIAQLRRAKFNYPVCIDEDDLFFKLNRFPSENTFRTFLLNENNKIIAMGNPIEDERVKTLYLKTIQSH